MKKLAGTSGCPLGVESRRGAGIDTFVALVPLPAHQTGRARCEHRAFLSGRTEESTPEEMLLVIHRLLHLLPRDYQARLANNSDEAEPEVAGKC